MKPLNEELVEREARRIALSRTEPARFENTLNRYLAAQGYATTPTEGEPRRGTLTAGGLVVPGHGQPTIVVAVDNSPGSYMALDHAAIEAELRGWEIRLIHVQPHHLVRRSLFEQRDRGAALLAEMGERIRARVPSLPVGTTLRVGSPSEVLVTESSTAGLMVVGNRGYGTVAGLLAPSISEHLAAHAAGPVLIVRVPGWAAGHGWAERPVLVGVDGSSGSAAALEFGLVEARLRGSQLLAVHATREPVSTGAVRDPFATGPLAGAAERIGGVRVRRRTVDGDPTEALVEASVHASALVVGSRGQGGLGRMLPGAVGRSLVHRAHCPVFVIPASPTV